jgi:nucleoid-associated protein YgaU
MCSTEPNRSSSKNNQASTKQQSRPSDKEQPKTYTLVSGDTLIKVARIQLGNESRWREIQKLNGISDAELTRLQVGMKLKLPG